MAEFSISDKITRRNEGLWQNDDADRGNAANGLGTFCGVASKMHPKWKGWPIIAEEIAKKPPQPQYGSKAYREWVKELNSVLSANMELMGLVETFYKRNFWDVLRLDEMNSQGAANHCYDHAINRGPATAALLLQKILGVMADGIIGPVTIKAANKMRDNELEALYRAARKADYERIIKINPALAQYRRTWLARC